MLQENEESVVLLIRCALQLFEDIRINFPIDSTVLQLKNKLADICPSKPVSFYFIFCLLLIQNL